MDPCWMKVSVFDQIELYCPQTFECNKRPNYNKKKFCFSKIIWIYFKSAYQNLPKFQIFGLFFSAIPKYQNKQCILKIKSLFNFFSPTLYNYKVKS